MISNHINKVMRRVALFLSFVVLGGCTSQRHGLRPPDTDEPIIAAMVDIVEKTERERLVADDGKPPVNLEKWIQIIIEPKAISRSVSLRIYRAHNAASDPAWIYHLAADPEGVIYRLGGFGVSDYPKAVARYMSRTGVISKRTALEIVSVYFKYVEHWHPGISSTVQSRKRIAATTLAGVCHSEVRVHDNGSATVSAVVFDEVSGGIDCVEVELSSSDGFVVTSRFVVSPRQRIEM